MIGRNMFIPNNKEVDKILEIFNYSPEYLKTISKLLLMFKLFTQTQNPKRGTRNLKQKFI